MAAVNRKLLDYRVQTSLYNTPIQVIYGTARVSGNLIWSGDWRANPISSTGGKFGSGKGAGGGKGGSGGQQYNYSSAMMVGICQGQINGIQNVWQDKNQYQIYRSKEYFVVPGGGGTYTSHWNGTNYQLDNGVVRLDPYTVTVNDYGSPGSTTYTGTQNTPMLKVASAPGAGQYTNNLGVYGFSAADAGKTVLVDYLFWVSSTSVSGAPLTFLNGSLFNGAIGQAPWTYLTSKHPDQALGYSELAYIAFPSLNLGSSGLMPNFNWEVMGRKVFGNGIIDAMPPAIIQDVLTDPLIGPLGWSNADLPAAGTQFGYDASGEVWKYCAANGIFISPVFEGQEKMATRLQEVLEIANANVVWSDGVLKLRSYGDTTAVGNGYQYTPSTQPIYDLDGDDFIPQGGGAWLTVNRPSVRDAYNGVQIEWVNRSSNYVPEPLSDQDDNAVALYGLRMQAPSQYHGITEISVAQQVVGVQLKRSVNIRNQYKFILPAFYALLEPMDLVTITDPFLGINTAPVRILTIEEDDKAQLTVTAEDFPWSTSAPTLHGKQVSSSFGPGYFASPGSINPPIFFQATAEITQDIMYNLLIGLSGGPNWGGCNVHVSIDNTNYTNAGKQTGASTMGVTTASLAAVNDPDTTSTLSVNLIESFGTLQSYSQQQADAFFSLILVDNELMSYQTATLTGTNQYNLTYLRRGVFGTVIAAHNSGAPFMFIDKSVFDWAYQQTDINTTRYFKFTSFNLSGAAEEDISQVATYPVTISIPRIRPYPWYPIVSVPLVTDVTFPNTAAYSTFAMALDYLETDAFNNAIAKVKTSGWAPVNKVNNMTPPTVVTIGTQQLSGNLGDGTYYCAVTSTNLDPTIQLLSCTQSYHSAIVKTVISGAASSGQVLVTVLAWDPASVGYIVYFGTDPNNLVAVTRGFGQPANFTVQWPTVQLSPPGGTFGPPDIQTNLLRMKIFRMGSGGVEYFVVGSVSGNVITTGNSVPGQQAHGVPWTTAQWVGRKVYLYYRASHATFPVLSRTCTTNSSGTVFTGTITVDGTALDTVVQAGDVFIVAAAPSVNNTATSCIFTDSAWNFTTNQWVGKKALIIWGQGTGIGLSRYITANTATTVTTQPFPVNALSNNSVPVIIEPTPIDSMDSDVLSVTTIEGLSVNFSIDTTNLQGASVIVKIVAVAADGTEGFDSLANWRPQYLPGISFSGPMYGGPTASITASNSPYYPQPNSQTIMVDTSGGPVTIFLPPISTWTGLSIIIVKTTSDANAITWNAASGDSFSGLTTGTITGFWASMTFKASGG
jgi:hypothetical protein